VFPIGQSAQKKTRSSHDPEASRLNANSGNGLFSSVLGHCSMRKAMSRFSWKSRALPNVISLAVICEKFPLYMSHLVTLNIYYSGEREMMFDLPSIFE